MSLNGVFYDIEKERAINEIKFHFDVFKPFFDKRSNLSIGILNFLLIYYNFDCVYIDYVKNFALLLESKQFEMFKIDDYLNPKLFVKRLIFTLLNYTNYDSSKSKVDINSNHFKEDSIELRNVNKRPDFNGHGVMRFGRRKMLVGKFENGWAVGRIRVYTPFFELLEVIEDYDVIFNNYLDSLV